MLKAFLTEVANTYVQ